MSLSLKDMNAPKLAVVIAANATFYFALLTSTLEFANLSNLSAQAENYVPAALLAILVGVLNAQIDHLNKARLVFWRWEHPLPGSQAFTRIVGRDPRIDPAELRRHQDPLPEDPIEQNRLWFRWYRQVQDEQGIRQVHREYLFTRDWSALTVLLAMGLSPLAIWQMDTQIAAGFVAAMVVQYLVVRRAAKHHGERFVASVLAYKSTESKQGQS